MKYAVQAALTLTLPTQADKLVNDVNVRIGNKPTWGEKSVIKGLDIDGKPQCSVQVRFDKKADMSDLFSFIKQQMVNVPVLKGSVSIHECSHAEQPRPCVIADQYIK